MMHNDNLVACVKVNGQILRETGSSVLLPFGCEYSILVKNLNSVRSQISVSVDGKDAVGRIVIAPNSSVELERFVQNGNLEAGNKFKFIERTSDIEKHRGIGPDDGLIRVEGWREKIYVPIPRPIPQYYDYPYPVPWPRPYPREPRPLLVGSLLRQQSMAVTKSTGGIKGSSSARAVNSVGHTASTNDAGITVPGSESRQKFVSVAGFPMESASTVIVLHLRGQVGELPVAQPVTVNMKPKCETCGKQNKPDAQYCPKCGTALVMYV